LTSLFVDGVDDERSPSNQARGRDAAIQGMLYKTSPDALSRPGYVRRKLPQKKTRNWIRRLTGADFTREARRYNGCRREAVITDDPPSIMHDHYSREALLLVGKCVRFQPMIKRRFPAGKLRKIMSCR
jgi:hypothetical protein